jgi:hypothetical protein
VLTAASVLWSVQPQSSWIEAGRTVSYLAVFGSGIALARLAPARWPGLLGAIAATATVLAGYALLVKVFPSTLDPADTFGRLRAPFDYFNATGLIGALGLPACLWSGARRDRARALRAAAVPAIAILATATVLSYSRGALLAALAGLVLWFAVVPLRLRGALVLALGLAGAAVLSLYAVHTHALTHDGASLGARTDAGHGFGIVLVLVLVLLVLAGVAAAYATDRVTLAPAARRRIGRALVVLVALLPLAGVVALAASSRGLTGEISHLVSTITNTNSGAPNTPGRLVQLGNARGRYWSEGLQVGKHSLLHGAGAFGYATAVTHYTSDANTVPNAHSFVIQTFADFGLLGIAIVIGLLVAWGIAAQRTITPRGSPGRDPELAGMLSILCVVVVFGIHSAIDWTWFIPGTALPALLGAGWLAGRGPLAGPVGLRPRARRVLDAPGIAAIALGLVTLTLLCDWAIWQPLRSADAQTAAIAALERGDSGAALGDAQTAADVDPVAIDPLFQLSAIDEGRGDRRDARAELLAATARQPDNAQSWIALGEFELRTGQPRLAIAALQRALVLDRSSAEAAASLASAQRAAG